MEEERRLRDDETREIGDREHVRHRGEVAGAGIDREAVYSERSAKDRVAGSKLQPNGRIGQEGGRRAGGARGTTSISEMSRATRTGTGNGRPPGATG